MSVPAVCLVSGQAQVSFLVRKAHVPFLLVTRCDCAMCQAGHEAGHKGVTKQLTES